MSHAGGSRKEGGGAAPRPHTRSPRTARRVPSPAALACPNTARHVPSPAAALRATSPAAGSRCRTARCALPTPALPDAPDAPVDAAGL